VPGQAPVATLWLGHRDGLGVVESKAVLVPANNNNNMSENTLAKYRDSTKSMNYKNSHIGHCTPTSETKSQNNPCTDLGRP